MNQEKWTKVDQFITQHLVQANPALEMAVEKSQREGLPPIQVSQPQGKMLKMLAQMIRAKKILEIGTLGGYSTIWMAQALPPDGKLITLEVDAKHAEVARENIKIAGYEKSVQVIIGRALDTLPTLANRGAGENSGAGQNSSHGPFDMFFIDADKATTLEYFEWAIKLSRPGSLIVVDNVVRDGEITDAGTSNSGVKGVRRFFEKLKSDARVEATAIQTVGNKGYDGFALAIVK